MKERDRTLLTGDKAREMFGEMADIAQVMLSETKRALIADYNGDENAAVKELSQLLDDTLLMQQVLMFLAAGQPSKARALLIETKRKAKK